MGLRCHVCQGRHGAAKGKTIGFQELCIQQVQATLLPNTLGLRVFRVEAVTSERGHMMPRVKAFASKLSFQHCFQTHWFQELSGIEKSCLLVTT